MRRHPWPHSRFAGLSPPRHSRPIADLGIAPGDSIARRVMDVWEFLPRLWKITEEILPANPGIVAT